jgi:hypothetical protein
MRRHCKIPAFAGMTFILLLGVHSWPNSEVPAAIFGVCFGAFCDFLDSGAECDCNEVFIPKAKQTMKPI